MNENIDNHTMRVYNHIKGHETREREVLFMKTHMDFVKKYLVEEISKLQKFEDEYNEKAKTEGVYCHSANRMNEAKNRFLCLQSYIEGLETLIEVQ